MTFKCLTKVILPLLCAYLVGCASFQIPNAERNKEIVTRYIELKKAKDYPAVWKLFSERLQKEEKSFEEWWGTYYAIDITLRDLRTKLVSVEVYDNVVIYKDEAWNVNSPDHKKLWLNKLYIVVVNGKIDFIFEHDPIEIEKESSA